MLPPPALLTLEFQRLGLWLPLLHDGKRLAARRLTCMRRSLLVCLVLACQSTRRRPQSADDLAFASCGAAGARFRPERRCDRTTRLLIGGAEAQEHDE